MARRLLPEELRAVCDSEALPFRSTADLPPLDRVIGQDRAVNATAFGIGMPSPGFNLFVLGPPATGKTTTMVRVLRERAASQATPPDWVYVFNFTDAYRPTALALPAGRGRELRDEMGRLVEECRTRLPRAFETEAFERDRSQILDDVGRRQQAEIARLEGEARANGFVIVRAPGALAVAPAPRGQPLTPDQFAALPEETRREIEARGHALEERVDAALRQLRQFEREARAAHEELVRRVAAAATRQLIQELRERFVGLASVERYLSAVEEDLIAHAGQFRHLDESRASLPFLPSPDAFLDRYRVNVIVDRSGEHGAPVVLEPHPTHGNLVGRVEHRAQLGSLVTDFTLIKGGALHRANSGYLVLEARSVLQALMSWEALKKALKSHSIRIEEPLEEFRPFSTMSLAPEPIPLDVKVVLIGSPLYYYLLYALDEDFRELFKVKVDFDDSLPRTREFEELYGRFVATACREEGLRHFAADGVAKLIEYGSRSVAHRARMTARMGLLLDLVRESAFWAAERRHELVTASDVSQAIVQKVNRANLIEERVSRMIAEGTLMIDTSGSVAGQVNGIAVVALGDHAFARPSRITARTFAGEPGVIDIEREAKLGGKVHSKGVMILTGFLAGRYARERSLALSASIAFEQQYEEIDGDSASSAELYALLSSLTGIPLEQRLAVTGSVNQRGEIQPVGAINEKIEGFFDVCRERGLTGREGVLIPEANTQNLMLREDVVEAVRQGQFQIHAVATVDEGLALLSGTPAGERTADGRFPDDSFNGAVERALAESAARLKARRAP